MSTATCGLPYYVSGVIPERNNLLVVGKDYFRNVMNVDVRINTGATKIDREAHTVDVLDLNANKSSTIPYNKLVLATGGMPVVPKFPGISLDGIFTLTKIRDADAIIFDSMLNYEEAVMLKKDWGHSAASIGVDLCLRENIRRLILFHHNPDNDDTRIFDMLEETMAYLAHKDPNSKLQIDIACEGWDIPVKPAVIPDEN